MDSNQGFFKARVLILAGLCLFLSGNVFSKEEEIESFRCGGRFIEYGMTMDDVLKTCPKSQHPSRQAQNSTTYYYEPKSKYSKRKYYEYKWYFERYGKFRVYVHFNRGRVSLITEDESIRD